MNNYIQITLNGEKKGLKFNNFAFEIFGKHIDAEATDTSIVYACIYAGLRGNAYVKKEELTKVVGVDENGKQKIELVTFEDVCDWVDAASNEDIIAATNCMSDTEKWKELLAKSAELIRSMQVQEEGEEKKS